MIRFHTFLIFLFSLSQLSFRGRAAEVREPGRRLCIEIALASSRCYFVLLFEGMVTILSRHSHFQKDNGSDICQILELSWALRMLCAKFKQIPVCWCFWLCLQSLPVFTFANQAGLDMLETTFLALQDIPLDKIFDESGRKMLCSEFGKIMQQVMQLSSLKSFLFFMS